MDDLPVAFSMGLSDEEKHDLEEMIEEFQHTKATSEQDLTALQQQIETLNQRMAYLTAMFLTIDRRMKPLYEIVHLALQKVEILNERIDTIIDSMRPRKPF